MRRARQLADHDPEFDPFGEHLPSPHRTRLALLGADFEFACRSPALNRLVRAAYGGLPKPRPRKAGPRLRVALRLSGRARPGGSGEPEPLFLSQGEGLLAAANASANFSVVSPASRSALVTVAPSMLRHPYHVRYELIEFAMCTLAARAQGLVSLHAACIGRDGRGVLLMGDSGSGKSTLALLCALAGLEFLSEDSAFVEPDALEAFGIANYLHVRAASLHWLSREDAAFIRRSPVITRRSGVRKFEVDLRRHRFNLARPPLKIQAIVHLSSKRAPAHALLRHLPLKAAKRRLGELQAYATGQGGWHRFLRQAAGLEQVELARGKHPSEGVDAIARLLDG